MFKVDLPTLNILISEELNGDMCEDNTCDTCIALRFMTESDLTNEVSNFQNVAAVHVDTGKVIPLLHIAARMFLIGMKYQERMQSDSFLEQILKEVVPNDES